MSAYSSVSPGDRTTVLAWLGNHVPEPRIRHILRVEVMARDLAEHHRLDAACAAKAGLMHDLAKYFSPDRLLHLAQTHGLSIDPVDKANPHLLHAPVSAIVAQETFGISDPDILAAIRNHTLGQPQMNPLSCVVFLADSLEPGRGDRPQLQAARELSRQDLHQAVALVCDLTLKHLIKAQQLIHPQMIQTRNWARLQTLKTDIT